ncbi:hypothetical protein [Sorangium sp. So ce341]|uniref:hypothetical protein n=1 Tax=Sorangium sp. So ce341 TaxID=3133302 RepID=UPI003F5F481E
MSGPKKLGMSRREMEWLVRGMLQRAPADPTALAQHLADVMMTLVEKNNQAIERALAERRDDDAEGG